MCGFENDVDDDFDWVFGSRNIQYYRQGPKTDHTTANTTGEGKPFLFLFSAECTIGMVMGAACRLKALWRRGAMTLRCKLQCLCNYFIN